MVTAVDMVATRRDSIWGSPRLTVTRISAIAAVGLVVDTEVGSGVDTVATAVDTGAGMAVDMAVDMVDTVGAVFLVQQASIYDRFSNLVSTVASDNARISP